MYKSIIIDLGKSCIFFSVNMFRFCLIVCVVLHIICAFLKNNDEYEIYSTTIPEKIDYDESIVLFNRIDNIFQFLNRAIANLEWRNLRNLPVTSEFYMYIFQLKQIFRDQWCTKFTDLRNSGVFANKKLLHFLCDGLRYTNDIARKMVNVSNLLSSTYDFAQICKLENRKQKCYNGELDVQKLMATSRNENELRWAWTAWRSRMSHTRGLFTELINLQNMAAQNNGYADIGEYWREEFEIPNFENFLEQMYRRVEPLYSLLHAVVRYRLARLYPDIVDTQLPIPAHLLGNLWSQNWETLIDIVFPNYTIIMPKLTDSMKRNDYNVMKMLKTAEDFYVSLGFPSLTSEFWKNSIFEQKNNSKLGCHPTAINMYRKNDFRMFACLETKPQDLDIIFHEMGHIQYYMAYQNQPSFFKNGINAAFHESIGDAIAYGATSLQYMQSIRLIRNITSKSYSEESVEMALLLRQALLKIPQLSNALIIEKWRWSIFSGKTKPSKYNTLWWDLHRQYMGIVPPSPRSEDFFDPMAKFHIAHNVPYARYFLGNLLQIQLFQGMCKVSSKVGSASFNSPLHKCEIYGSRTAGKYLRSMMKLGSSVDWKYALRVITGYAEYRVEPFLSYYKPIHNWLKHEIEHHDIPIGWN